MHKLTIDKNFVKLKEHEHEEGVLSDLQVSNFNQASQLNNVPHSLILQQSCRINEVI